MEGYIVAAEVTRFVMPISFLQPKPFRATKPRYILTSHAYIPNCNTKPPSFINLHPFLAIATHASVTMTQFNVTVRNFPHVLIHIAPLLTIPSNSATSKSHPSPACQA